MLGIRDPYEHQFKVEINMSVKAAFMSSTKINEEKLYEVELPVIWTVIFLYISS